MSVNDLHDGHRAQQKKGDACRGRDAFIELMVQLAMIAVDRA